MNKHINKKRLEKQTRPMPENLMRETRDGMPREVALEMLCTARPITNRMRKVFAAARENVFISTREPKDMGIKLENRFKQSTMAQLLKWRRRACARRMECQAKYLHLQKKGDELGQQNTPESIARRTVLLRAMEQLSKLAKRIDLFHDLVEDAIDARKRGLCVTAR